MEKLVISSYSRTPFCKTGRGAYSSLEPDAMLIPVLESAIERAKITPNMVEAIVCGNVLNSVDAVTQIRKAAIHVGIPIEVQVLVVNRQCASGIEAINLIGMKIRSKEIKIGIAVGFELMSRDEMKTGNFTDKGQLQTDLHMSMGQTAENIANIYGVKKHLCDDFAFNSQEKAFLSQQSNVFKEEIFNGGGSDEGIRLSELIKLSSLRPVFASNGVCSAGNCSQLSDGAAAMVICSSIDCKLPILGYFNDCVTVGIEPRVMGLGPIKAIDRLFKRNNISDGNIDFYEINEAFAVQTLVCINKLRINPNKVNVFGGAIALGHPLGATGIRLVGTLLNALKRNNRCKGVVSLCVGSGMGIAALIERPRNMF